jgi:hypothetical protein
VGVLVSLAALKTYLGDAPTSGDDDELLEQLIDDVEALFASETLRALSSYRRLGRRAPKSSTAPDRRPVPRLPDRRSDLDQARLRPPPPDETLTVADKNVIVYAVGARRITRTDGGCFGRAGQPRYVQVVYDAAATSPATHRSRSSR